MGEVEVFGARCLDLLADEAMVTVLGQLRLETLSAIEMGTGRAGFELQGGALSVAQACEPWPGGRHGSGTR